MKFERLGNNSRRAVLEHDYNTGLHNWTVATKALGVQTALNCRDIAKRNRSARLGVRLGILDISVPNEIIGMPPVFVDTRSLPFRRSEAETLGQALVTYINSTTEDILYLVRMEPHRANLRSVETEMAQLMFAQLSDEFGAIAAIEEPVFGFSTQ
jgi:hypothetical protein